jgi:serine/threonine protein kinase
MVEKTIAHYEVLDEIGAGGMGVVYRARDTRLDREAAIKALPEELAEDSERLARFEREAKLLASLNNPYIATVYGLEEVEGRRFLAMELVEGENLAERLSKGPIPVQKALGLARQIAEALEAAHESEVIHRDVKPGNIMIGEDGKAKVLDFGLAKALQTDREDPRHARLHEPGAGQWQGSEQAIRHLGLRLRALRDAGRAKGLSGGHRR